MSFSTRARGPTVLLGWVAGCAAALTACAYDTELGSRRPIPRPTPGVRARVTYRSPPPADGDSLTRRSGTIVDWRGDTLLLEVAGDLDRSPTRPGGRTLHLTVREIRVLETYRGRPSIVKTGAIAAGLWGLAGLAVGLIAECSGDGFDCSDASWGTVAVLTAGGVALGGLVWTPIVWSATSPWGAVAVQPPARPSGDTGPRAVGIGVSVRAF